MFASARAPVLVIVLAYAYMYVNVFTYAYVSIRTDVRARVHASRVQYARMREFMWMSSGPCPPDAIANEK